MTDKSIKVEIGDVSIAFAADSQFTVKTQSDDYQTFTKEGLLAWRKDVNRAIDSILRLLDMDDTPQKPGEYRYVNIPEVPPAPPLQPSVFYPKGHPPIFSAEAPPGEIVFADAILQNQNATGHAPEQTFEELVAPKSQPKIFVDDTRTHRNAHDDSRANGVTNPMFNQRIIKDEN